MQGADDAQLAEKIYKGIQRAAKTRNMLYNIDTDELQTVEDAQKYCIIQHDKTGRIGSCQINGMEPIVGSKMVQERIMPRIRVLERLGLGRFSMLPENVIMEIINKTNDIGAIVSLCSTSETFRQKCTDLKIFQRLTTQFFPGERVISDDPATNFSELFRTRLTIQDFQAADALTFDYHSTAVEKFIKDVTKTINNDINKSNSPAHIVSRLSALDAIILMQPPRYEIYNAYNTPKLLAFFQTTDIPDEFLDIYDDLVKEAYDYDFDTIAVPHLADTEVTGIDHYEYVALLQDLVPSADLRLEDWVQEINNNIQERIITLSDGDTTEEEYNEIAKLIKLQEYQVADRYYFWLYNPDIGTLIDQLKQNWDLMLDLRIENMTSEELLMRYQKMTDNKTRSLKGNVMWYSLDFDLEISNEMVQNLLKANLIVDEDLQEENYIIVDPTRWNMWSEAINEVLDL